MFGIGQTELIIVGVIALLLFGNRLPSVMRSLGSGVSEFKKGLDDVNREIHREVATEPPKAHEEVAPQAEAPKEPAASSPEHAEHP
jgi:sec-independent protein translocase protein TatA